jgi:hypothetical protein
MPIAVVPLVFEPLPLGSIKPQGWLNDQMHLMADGLGGHLADFWKYVANSTWTGGKSEYSILHEAWPYWLNAIVPLAYAIDDERLKAQIRRSVDYVLAHQADDGWIGPETGSERNIWPRPLVFFGFTQLAEADPAYETRIVHAMQKFSVLMRSMLANNYTGLIYHKGDKFSWEATQWGLPRTQEMMVSLMWLYEKHPGNYSDILMDNMRYMHEGGFKWDFWFQEGVFPKKEISSLPRRFYDEYWYFQHGVNVGEGLKSTAVYRRLTHNDTLLDITRQGVNWTFTYHGSASGTILADEIENGLSPFMG